MLLSKTLSLPVSFKLSLPLSGISKDSAKPASNLSCYKSFHLVVLNLPACPRTLRGQNRGRQLAVSQALRRLTGCPYSWVTMLSLAHTSHKHVLMSSLAVPQFCAAWGRGSQLCHGCPLAAGKQGLCLTFLLALVCPHPPSHTRTQKWAQPGHWPAQWRGGNWRGRNKICQSLPNMRLKNKFAELC